MQVVNTKILNLADKVRFVKETDYPHQDVIFEKFGLLLIQECIKEVSNIEDITKIMSKFGIKE